MSVRKRTKSPARGGAGSGKASPSASKATDFKPYQPPHGPIREVFPDVFQVRGTSNMGPLVITRNMTIVRHKGNLSLINTVRLSEDGLRELEGLGRIENVIKVAGLHGVDDPFYVRTYGATMWATAGMTHKAGVETDVEMDEDTELPFPQAKLFIFRSVLDTKPEAAIVLARHGGVVISGDALQNMVNTDGCNAFGVLASYAMGFVHPCGVGPGWIMEQGRSAEDQEASGSPSLAEDLERLMAEHAWTNLLPAHGDPVTDGSARRGLLATIERLGPGGLTLVKSPSMPLPLVALSFAMLAGLLWAINHLSALS